MTTLTTMPSFELAGAPTEQREIILVLPSRDSEPTIEEGRIPEHQEWYLPSCGWPDFTNG